MWKINIFIQVRRKREVPYYFEAVSACFTNILREISENLSVTAPVSLIIRIKIKSRETYIKQRFRFYPCRNR